MSQPSHLKELVSTQLPNLQVGRGYPLTWILPLVLFKSCPRFLRLILSGTSAPDEKVSLPNISHLHFPVRMYFFTKHEQHAWKQGAHLPLGLCGKPTGNTERGGGGVIINKREAQEMRLGRWAHQLERRKQGCVATRVGSVRANAVCAPPHFAPPFCARMGEGYEVNGSGRKQERGGERRLCIPVRMLCLRAKGKTICPTT